MSLCINCHIPRSSTADCPSTQQLYLRSSSAGKTARSVRERREVATLTVKSDDIAESVDLPRVCIARGVDIIERVVASPIKAGVTGRRCVVRPPCKLAFDNGGA